MTDGYGLPLNVIEAAELEAAKSPCSKSKRGVVIFRTRPAGIDRDGALRGYGFNGPPGQIGCDGSPECRLSCGKRCCHAETRALRSIGNVGGCDLVHVKIGNDGKVVPGGGPSCWQCSREILDAGISGVWLFEHTECPRADCPMCNGEACNLCGAGCYAADKCEHDVIDRHAGVHDEGEWKRYTAEVFHRETRKSAEIY